MGKWAERNWDIQTKDDLDDYTYYVAGVVGIFLSKAWDWSYGFDADMDLVAFLLTWKSAFLEPIDENFQLTSPYQDEI